MFSIALFMASLKYFGIVSILILLSCFVYNIVRWFDDKKLNMNNHFPFFYKLTDKLQNWPLFFKERIFKYDMFLFMTMVYANLLVILIHFLALPLCLIIYVVIFSALGLRKLIRLKKEKKLNIMDWIHFNMDSLILISMIVFAIIVIIIGGISATYEEREKEDRVLSRTVVRTTFLWSSGQCM